MDLVVLLTVAPPRRHGRFQLLEAFPSALNGLRADTGRSVLTTLGISIGVAAVIAIVTLAAGASETVGRQLSRLGTNLLTISPGSAQSSGIQGGAGTNNALKTEDAESIARDIVGVSVSPVLFGGAQLVAGAQNWPTRVQAVTPEYLQIQSWQIADGAAFTQQANASAQNVAIVGETVASHLFGAGQPRVGQLIRIRSVPFTVVGVLARKGTGLGGDLDDTVLIPFRTGAVRLFGETSLNQILVQVADARQMDATSRQLDALLRQRHRLAPGQADDFSIRSNTDLLATVANVTQAMTLLLAAVAGVSLIVGGIGIMNIMLVSVSERTAEIGIRLAVGAQRSDVLCQFLIEAVLLSLVGGIIGMLAGTGFALGLPVVADRAGRLWSIPILTDLPTVIPWATIALAFAISALIGVFFGLYPARKAALLDPIVALRYE